MSNKKLVVVSLKCSYEMKDWIREQARQNGVTISTWLLRLVTQYRNSR